MGLIFVFFYVKEIETKAAMPLFYGLFLVVFAAAFAIGPNLIEKFNRKIENIPPIIFGVFVIFITILICGAITDGPFSRIPRIQDEINYFFQGKILASGQLYLDTPRFSEFFKYIFFVNDGKTYSLFQPGWPLFLALGWKLGIPWLMAPILGGVAAGSFYGVARRLLGEIAGKWATLMLLSSAVFLYQSASMMAHGPAAAISLVAFYFSIRAWNEGHRRWFILAGFAAGWLISIRAATAIALMAPMVIFGVGALFLGKLRWRDLGWIILGLIPLAGFQAYNNWLFTGTIFSFPQDHYFALTEPVKNCHRLGIGKGIGCHYEHGVDIVFGKEGYTWARAWDVSLTRLKMFRSDLFGIGFGIVLIFLAWFSEKKVKYLLFGFPVALISVYHFYYYPAGYLGARYYFESVPFALLLIALGAQGLFHSIRNFGPKKKRVFHAIFIAFFVALSGFSIGYEVPRRWNWYKGLESFRRGFHDTLDASNLKNAIVLVPKGHREMWIGFWRNDLDFQGDVIVARDLGKENSQLKQFYPDRTFYRYSHSKRKMIKYPIRKSDTISIEVENKFPISDRPEDAYAAAQDLRYLKVYFSGGAQLFIKMYHPQDAISFPQYIGEASEYSLSAMMGSAGDYGIVQFEIDGKKIEPSIDLWSEKVTKKSWKSKNTIFLKKGMHTFRVRVISKNERSKGYFAGVDIIQLKKVEGQTP